MFAAHTPRDDMLTVPQSSRLDLIYTLIDGLERLAKQYHTRGVLSQHPALQQQLLLTLALLRNRLAPSVSALSPLPLHVAVVGGTNCGKSTVTNVLVGDAVARWSLQGGFTAIPTGYALPPLLEAPWQAHPLVLKGLRLLPDVGAPAALAREYLLEPLDPRARVEYLQQAVIWDTPDVDSRYARERQHRVLEIIGLADVVVLVLSPEKYADHTAYELLSLLLESAKTVVVCLNKFSTATYAEGLKHFRRQMLDTPERHQAVGEPVLLAYVTPAALDRLWSTTSEISGPVRQALAARLRQPAKLRQQAVQGAVQYVAHHVEALLQPAERECALLAEWREHVEQAFAGCMTFYRQHYLEDERRYDSFRLALFRLLELLDVPGINRLTRLLRRVITTPVRWGWGLLKKLATSGPQTATRVEVVVLEESLATATTALHTFLLERQGDHPVWRQLRERFEARQSDLQQGVMARLHQHEEMLAQAIEAAARQIYARLQDAPAQLQALRGGKLALEVAVTVAAVKSAGLSPDDLLYGSLAYAGLQTVLQLLGEQYVHNVKRTLQETQAAAVETLLRDSIVVPLQALPVGPDETQNTTLTEAELHCLRQCTDTLVRAWGGEAWTR